MMGGKIFDLEEFIANSKRCLLQSYTQALKTFNSSQPAGQFKLCLGSEAVQSKEPIVNQRGSENDSVAYAQKKDCWSPESIKGITTISFGVVSLKASLRKCLAGTIIWNYMGLVIKTAISTAFEFFISGDEFCVTRPGPPLSTGCGDRFSVPAEKCTVIEDLDVDVPAKKTIGMKCLGVAIAPCSEELFGASMCVSSIEELNGPVIPYV